MLKNIPQNWLEILEAKAADKAVFASAMKSIVKYLTDIKEHGAVIFPTEENIFNALKLIDTDFVYREGDPSIELTSDMSRKFETIYQKQKLNKSR